MKAAVVLAVVVLALCGGYSVCRGQSLEPDDPLLHLQEQLDQQGRELRELRRRLDHPDLPFGHSVSGEDEGCAPSSRVRVPLVTDLPEEATCDDTHSAPKFVALDYYVDHDRGFVIRPFDPQRNPFELNISGWIQFRHHAFARDVETWTDNAGITRPVRNRNAFDIERGRLVFSGFAVDERLTYFLHLDGDTDGAHAVDFFDYWWAWRFGERFQVQMGKRKVPASRQWLLGARRTRFVDRPMANDFFRPDRTVGLFGVGTIGQTGHYEIMAGNGYQSNNLPNSLTDNKLTFAATNYFDPLGDYGGQLVDFDQTCEPLVRIGHSLVYSPQAGDTNGIPLDEADFIRLSDGTRLTETGALAPGITVSDFDLVLYGVDAAFKWRGWSANAEVFLQWVEQIEGDGVLPVTELFRHGFYVEGGFFLVPKKLDVNLRYSQVNGEYGTASESAAGVNWYPLGKATMKVSFDVTQLEGSPLQNTTTDILVGDTGTLFRTQFQAEF